MPVNVLDIGFGILILLFVVRGLLQGLISEVAGLLGIFLGLFIALQFGPQLAPQFAGIVDNPVWAKWLSCGILFIATLIVVALLATLLKRFLSFALIPSLDYLLGGIVGFLKGILICALGLYIMQRFVPDSPFLKKSAMVPYLDGVIGFVNDLLPSLHL